MFKVGDEVTWESHAGSYVTRKTGRIVEVVPAETRPERLLGKLVEDYNVTKVRRTFAGTAKPRATESYLVAVIQQGSIKPVIYWPTAARLSHVQQLENEPTNHGAEAPV